MVANCTHGRALPDTPEGLEQRLAVARRALRGAELLVDAAEDMIDADEMANRAYELLEDAEKETDEARSQLEFEAIEADTSSERIRTRAVGIAATAGVEAPDATSTIEAAEVKIEIARNEVVDSEAATADVSELIQSMGRLVGRISKLRELLDSP